MEETSEELPNLSIHQLGPDPTSNKNKAEKNSQVARFANLSEDPCCRSVEKNFLMLWAVRISSYGCTWEVWRALKKLELLSAATGATLTHFSCSPNFPRASIIRYTYAKHEQFLNFTIFKPSGWKCYKTIGSYFSCAFIEMWSTRGV